MACTARSRKACHASAGQNVEYLARALMFKDGTRASPIMQPIARGLSADEIASSPITFEGDGAACEGAGRHRPSACSPASASPRRAPATWRRASAATGRRVKARGSLPGHRGPAREVVVDRIHEFPGARAARHAPAPHDDGRLDHLNRGAGRNVPRTVAARTLIFRGAPSMITTTNRQQELHMAFDISPRTAAMA